MLKKKERLTASEFDRFFSSGRRRHTDFLTMIYSPHPSFHGAVVVGKKVFKRAVDRNLLRRRLYNIMYGLSRANSLKGVYIILAKPNAGRQDFQTLKEAVLQLIKS